MTQEEKQLLLIDLCGRLPHGVKVDHFDVIKELLGVIPSSENVMVGYDINNYEDSVIEDIKPYLRPMAYMTEEEEGMYNLLQGISHLAEQHWTAKDGKIYRYADAIDWLNEHHFDYRGLIPMGLALEAPEDMYKTE